jgi:hypothetical protein
VAELSNLAGDAGELCRRQSGNSVRTLEGAARLDRTDPSRRVEQSTLSLVWYDLPLHAQQAVTVLVVAFPVIQPSFDHAGPGMKWTRYFPLYDVKINGHSNARDRMSALASREGAGVEFQGFINRLAGRTI